MMNNKVKSTQSGGFQLFDDILNLVGSFSKLGRVIATAKLQSTAETANRFVHSKMDATDLRAQLSGAADNLEAISDYALHTDVKQVVDDVGAFARKHPVTALVSVIAAGAIISRLMRKTPVITKVKKQAVIKRATPKSKAKKSSVAVRRKANGTAQANA